MAQSRDGNRRDLLKQAGLVSGVAIAVTVMVIVLRGLGIG